jgi:hypothetical protein
VQNVKIPCPCFFAFFFSPCSSFLSLSLKKNNVYMHDHNFEFMLTSFSVPPTIQKHSSLNTCLHSMADAWRQKVRNDKKRAKIAESRISTSEAIAIGEQPPRASMQPPSSAPASSTSAPDRIKQAAAATAAAATAAVKSKTNPAAADPEEADKEEVSDR